ncbi:hypothetical protein WJX74_003344 [Apatococcus lobatus]|uniref:Cell division protein FtsL n=1 Tax=Apatococcus lobatus TaxID=904363 RepID=A0AAW1QTH7_9CHLO
MESTSKSDSNMMVRGSEGEPRPLRTARCEGGFNSCRVAIPLPPRLALIDSASRMLLLFGAMAAFYVWMIFRAVQRANRIGKLEEQVAQLRMQYTEFQLYFERENTQRALAETPVNLT